MMKRTWVFDVDGKSRKIRYSRQVCVTILVRVALPGGQHTGPEATSHPLSVFVWPAENGFYVFIWLKDQKKNIFVACKSNIKFKSQCP
jgi:hypothetical protein